VKGYYRELPVPGRRKIIATRRYSRRLKKRVPGDFANLENNSPETLRINRTKPAVTSEYKHKKPAFEHLATDNFFAGKPGVFSLPPAYR